jgi:trimethylamine monooxygenase
MEQAKRICIIGAGASGICTLKAFAYYKDQLEANGNPNGEIFPEIICYEQMAEPAGIWNYTWRPGTDPTGRILHSVMYSDLYINIPKEAMEFRDYTFEEHIGFNCPSFIARGMCKDYLDAYLEKSGMKPCVQFSTRIEEVNYSKETKIFTVKISDLKIKSIITKEFDYVAVCAGHLVLPFIPEYPGFDTTDIRIIYSRDVRGLDEYRGRRVMVMGSSFSGEDLCCLLLKHGVKKIVLSNRNSKGTSPVSAQNNKWGSDALVTAPGLAKLLGETCHFVDGITHDVDVIILCTCYKHSYDYLQQDLIVEPVNNHWPLNLYKGVLPLTADN